jgi:polyisoprenyl-teichoic acid--peptidoglycan teichoic acid transferase
MFGRIVGAMWYLIVCAVFLGAGSVIGWAGRSALLAGLLNPFHRTKPPQEAFGGSSQTLLILGCDQDVYYKSLFVQRHAARSDMMLVAKLDFVNKQITGVSIPRDTWCQLPGYKEHKINAYYTLKKFTQDRKLLTKQAVEYLIGVKIDRVIVIDYDAFQKMVDVIGGVPVNVPREMDYDDNAGNLHVHLKPGKQVLNGYDAMCYVRYRHSNKRNQSETDFQRQERQKDLLLGFKQSVLANPARLPEIANLGKAVLGNSLDDEQILSLAMFGKSVGQQRIKLGVIPTREEGNGLRLVADELPKVLQEYNLTSNSPRVSFRQTR